MLTSTSQTWAECSGRENLFKPDPKTTEICLPSVSSWLPTSTFTNSAKSGHDCRFCNKHRMFRSANCHSVLISSRPWPSRAHTPLTVAFSLQGPAPQPRPSNCSTDREHSAIQKKPWSSRCQQVMLSSPRSLLL